MPEDTRIPKSFKNGVPVYNDSTEFVGPKPLESQVPTAPNQLPTSFKNGKPIYLGQSLVPSTVGTDVSKPVPQGDLQDPTPFIRRMLPGLLPAGGAALGSVLGPFGTAGGAAAGSLASQGLRHLLPGTFGDSGPQSGLDSGVETGIDVLGQAVIPEALKKLMASGVKKTVAEAIAATWLKKFPGVKEGLSKELISQVPKPYPESGIIETMGENAKDVSQSLAQKIANAKAAAPSQQTGPTLFNAQGQAIPHPPPPPNLALTAAQQEYADTFGGNTVGNKLIRMGEESQLPTDVARSQTYKDISNTALSDLTHIRNAKLATGDIIGIEQLGMNRLLGKGASAEASINPKAILDELNGPKSEIYKEAIRPMTVTNLTKMMEEIQAQETGALTNRVISYSKGRLGVALAGGALLGGPISKGAATIYLTNSALGKFASNPDNAKMIIQAMRTGSSSPQASLLQSAIVNGLRGAEVILRTPDGKEKKVTIPDPETSQ